MRFVPYRESFRTWTDMTRKETRKRLAQAKQNEERLEWLIKMSTPEMQFARKEIMRDLENLIKELELKYGKLR